MKQPNFDADDFAPAPSSGSSEVISRPSLSYWQDAWRRLKKNKRAMLSAFFIAFMGLFCFLGPLVWTVRHDDVFTFEQRLPPSWSFRSAQWLVVGDSPAAPSVHAALPGTFDAACSPGGLRFESTPTTLACRIVWEPVPGAIAYRVYRNEIEPRRQPGLPMGKVEGCFFEDSLRLLPIDYHYSVIPVGPGDVEGKVAVIKSRPIPAVSYADAVAAITTLNRQRDEPLPAPEIGKNIELQAHPLGTDGLGRDMLARIMSGGRISLFIGLLAPLVYIFVGVLYGAFAGYVGGWLDNLMMRGAEFVVALPFLLFMILLKVIIGDRMNSLFGSSASLMVIFIALVLLAWPSSARLVRGQVLQIRNEAYVQASMMLGAPRLYLILRHMIPNTMGVILVSLSFAIPGAIFAEAFLSFIGLGVQAPQTSWGALCQEGLRNMNSSPHELILPALCISLTVLAFNTLGDGLRDALDAKMRSKE